MECFYPDDFGGSVLEFMRGVGMIAYEIGGGQLLAHCGPFVTEHSSCDSAVSTPKSAGPLVAGALQPEPKPSPSGESSPRSEVTPSPAAAPAVEATGGAGADATTSEFARDVRVKLPSGGEVSMQCSEGDTVRDLKERVGQRVWLCFVCVCEMVPPMW